MEMDSFKSDVFASWWDVLASRPFLLELFALSNVAFLIVDVYVAHAFNDFAHWAEWIPIYFAGAGTIALLVAVVQEYRRRIEQSRWDQLRRGMGLDRRRARRARVAP
jgi:hypothetical protein